MRHPDLQSGGRHLWLRANGDHQHHHRRRDNQLYHQRHHAQFDRRHGVQQPGEHQRQSTLQAIAYETGYTNSAVASGNYFIQCAAPSFNPAAGTYTTSTSVTITTRTGGATMRYTTNGTTPSETVGTVYSSAVSITATSTLQAIAYLSGYGQQPDQLRGLHHPVRRPELQSGGRRLWPRAVGDHQHHHRRGEHQLHHQWHRPELDGRYGVQPAR